MAFVPKPVKFVWYELDGFLWYFYGEVNSSIELFDLCIKMLDIVEFPSNDSKMNILSR